MPLMLPVILLFIVLLLVSSKTALSLATLGLTLWLENMVPTLLPFMILSGILTGLKLQELLCRPLRGCFGRLFHTTSNGAYCIIMGFLCGFPMGAFCVADLYQKGQLSKEESVRLIPFCNNIGPVYFYSFAVPLLGLQAPSYQTLPLLTFGMYGIPLLYGVFSRAAVKPSPAVPASLIQSEKTEPSLFAVMDEAISHAGKSMLRLCGYMILFNILMLPLYSLQVNGFYSGILHSVFEISGGIRVLQGYLILMPEKRMLLQLLMLTALSFGGFCCAGQSECFLHAVSLSPGAYLLRRLLIAMLAGGFYAVCLFSGWLF
ncbi:MAG: hypothetical protein HDQ98_08620 [Lachnospiraceae bacterium]|nr:hypothetical protein [Lachnospiraceae bacterium]